MRNWMLILQNIIDAAYGEIKQRSVCESRKSREKSGRGYLRRRSRQEEGDPKEAQVKAALKRACGKEEPHGRLEQKAMERRRKQKKCKDRLQEVGKDGEKSKLCGRRGG